MLLRLHSCVDSDVWFSIIGSFSRTRGKVCLLLEHYHVRNNNTHCRRPPLALYMCTEAIYGLFYSLKSKGLVKSLPNGEVRALQAQILFI